MIDIQSWTSEFQHRLHGTFPNRVRFVGLQGSYGRGEATEESDIDLVVVLDRVELPDLKAYRALAGAMPQGNLACGFLCGEAELAAWPAWDALQLALDTKPLFGTMPLQIPAHDSPAVAEALRTGASALYHAAVHCFLYDADPAASLPALEKAAFFTARLDHFRRTGDYLPTRRAVSAANPAWDGGWEERYGALIRWSGGLLSGS